MKALGAAAASSGSVAMVHVVGVTPEAPTLEAATGGVTVSQVVVGYADAPRTASFDMLGRAWIRHGWHDPEKEGDVAFRWTSEARAEARFFTVRPEPLMVTLGLMPIAGSAREQLRVSMNGRPLLRDATDADTWQVPAETLHPGANTLTLEAPVVTGPPGDRRRLGLKVSSIVLQRTASF